MKKFFIIFVSLFIIGCSNTTPEQIEQLKEGMSKEEVLKVLGQPYTKVYRTNGCVLKYSYFDNGYHHYLYVYIENDKVDYWY